MLKLHSTHYFYCVTKQHYIKPCSKHLPKTNFEVAPRKSQHVWQSKDE